MIASEASVALATEQSSNRSICYEASRIASKRTGVPLAVLLAIATIESGKHLEGQHIPWPWTLNTRGKGAWFDSKSKLLEQALFNIANGEQSFDVGCFQLNYKWHGQNFTSLDSMIDPIENASYAAGFLKELFREFGDWTEAAGAYHSRTDVHNERYKEKYLQAFNSTSSVAPPIRRVTSVNNFPLLKRQETHGRFGSLVPSATGSTSGVMGSLLQ